MNYILYFIILYFVITYLSKNVLILKAFLITVTTVLVLMLIASIPMMIDAYKKEAIQEKKIAELKIKMDNNYAMLSNTLKKRY